MNKLLLADELGRAEHDVKNYEFAIYSARRFCSPEIDELRRLRAKAELLRDALNNLSEESRE